MTDTTEGYDHQTDALLAIDRSLDDSERAAFLAYVADHWPRLTGAHVADVLEMTDSYDMFLNRTEPFYEEHDAALSGLRGVTAGLHALIILGRELTMENLLALLTRAGLRLPDDVTETERRTS